MSRDWRDHLNALAYCHGCGRFGFPSREGTRRVPKGWKMLYQPHGDAPPMLLVCGDACSARVREAMALGPVHEPLETSKVPPMPADVREAMMAEFRAHIASQLEEDPFPAANEPPPGGHT